MNNFKKFLVVSGLAILTVLSTQCTTFAKGTDPAVVGTVDFQRYSGTWFEIGHKSNFFQNGCLRSTAEYKVLTADSVSVYNVCEKSDGTKSDISGTATVVDSSVPAKLKVRFNFFARGDYWVVALDPNYEWAIVSGPAKKSLFILSRTAPMDPQLLNRIIAQLTSEGYDLSDLVFDKY